MGVRTNGLYEADNVLPMVTSPNRVKVETGTYALRLPAQYFFEAEPITIFFLSLIRFPMLLEAA